MWGILLHTLKLDRTKEHQPDRNNYGPETERKREGDVELNEYFLKKKRKIFFVGVVLSVERTLLFAHFLFNHRLSHATALFKT